MTPKVTIVSSCYNHSRYIIEHLESVRNQDYPNIEHIIIDDASTDDSPMLIERWIADTGHECTFIRHKENKGICASLNESIRLSTGEFWGHVGTDDILPPHRTTAMAGFLRDNPEAPMVTADAIVIDGDGNESELRGERSAFRSYLKLHPAFIEAELGTFRSLFQGNYVPTWLIRRATFDEVGIFDESTRLEDWDMWLRISHLKRIPFIDEPLLFYRWHHANASTKADFMRRAVMEARLLNYERAKSHLEPALLRRVMIDVFRESVINPRSLSNMIAFLQSPARATMFFAMIDYARGFLGYRPGDR